MKALMVEICWSGNEKKDEFQEMTEIVATELHSIDGIIVTGRTFHSYIRPVFHHWKLKKASHSNYSNWWLASPFPKVMDSFIDWNRNNSVIPYVVWDVHLFSIWNANAGRHGYSFPWPDNVIYLKEELKRIKNPNLEASLLDQEKLRSNKLNKNSVALKKTKNMFDIMSENLDLTRLRQVALKMSIREKGGVKKKNYYDELVGNLKDLIEEGDASVEQISEWSQLSIIEVRDVLNSNKQVGHFQIKQLKQAWTMWETMQELKGDWKL